MWTRGATDLPGRGVLLPDRDDPVEPGRGGREEQARDREIELATLRERERLARDRKIQGSIIAHHGSRITTKRKPPR